MTKIKNSFTFFCEKPVWKPVKVITNSLKTLDFATPIPFDKTNVIVNLYLTRSGNKQTMEGTKLRS